MLNKKIICSILFIGLVILSAQCGWGADTPAVGADVAMKTDSLSGVFGKFALTMFGVVISLIIIFCGLLFYKKFNKNPRSSAKDLYNDGMTSPDSVDEAIAFFINKNRIQ